MGGLLLVGSGVGSECILLILTLALWFGARLDYLFIVKNGSIPLLILDYRRFSVFSFHALSPPSLRHFFLNMYLDVLNSRIVAYTHAYGTNEHSFPRFSLSRPVFR